MSSLGAATDRLKQLYRDGSTDAEVWQRALEDFQERLAAEGDATILARCVVDDVNWELPVAERLRLSDKAREVGADAHSFLVQHYGYLCAHLDPGDERHLEAARQLERLLAEADR